MRSLASAIDHVERVRGVSIDTQPLKVLDRTSVCGLLLVGASRCVIFHAVASSPLHRLQCILHELGHLLLEHDRHGRSAHRLERFLPGIELEAGDRIFGRDNLLDRDEVDAELLADLLAAGIRRRPHQQTGLEEYFG
ncbi:ImmA/IrrE family metallo-endopeptidase [Plantibacter sp. MCCC 1A11337]|uniref:ImmA/IrrE family metallo-endopeptidase n=1 Tax=Plantibacter sp. MCCC 1A11337 TaxID=2736644 RepID=UPI001581A921|nr:ImmA/IrrE family metallo-endopeptidase [Plantibacter sp. MCCC 1A11337]NUJ89171.1 ImmA/IrrE family metallo-endopeptidase [Plantibacter sp. MCCC 1A11337]